MSKIPQLPRGFSFILFLGLKTQLKHFYQDPKDCSELLHTYSPTYHGGHLSGENGLHGSGLHPRAIEFQNTALSGPNFQGT